MVLGTLIEVFHGDPQTAIAALDTLPLLLKPGKSSVKNVLQKTKPHERVIQMVSTGMVAYLTALGDTVGEDIEDRAKSAFTALGLSLKYLDRSMFGMARCLLFSQSPVIRQGAMTLWKDANDETTESLMVSEVLKHLQPISINLRHKQTTDHSTSSTKWKLASTRIGTDKIMIHVNLPSEKRSKNSLSECGHLTTVEILRALSTHPHILSMWAYRIDQFPVFYITDDYSQHNFQEVLYYSAKDEAWFQPLELMQFLIQALEAVIALHEHGVIQRDLTAASFAYDKQSKSIKLCRFMLARKCGREETVVDRECLSIPMRWSAPESLKRHHFSMRSDYWMVGHLIYEVITHGCLPYSDLEGQNEYTIEKL
ncbi:tyrosine kinase receptor Cad96Ca-like, partial [Haliotis rubra]|uniref:tyrosine kinase receptor Cad96Ca-like n=1 Tax=Haliotis rubra TaxID=36100 RepID=UPI001EE594AD